MDFLKAILAVTPYRTDPRSMPPDCVGGERLASRAPARGEWKSGLNKLGAARIVAWPRQLTILAAIVSNSHGLLSGIRGLGVDG